MMRMGIALMAAGLAAASSGVAMDHAPMEHMAHMAMAAEDSPSTQEYKAAMMKMHKAMDFPYTNDADIDFLRGMIAHHQAAVDMAQTQLKYGHNNQVRRLAQDIIRGQNLEIRWMKTWLAQLEANRAQGTAQDTAQVPSRKPGFEDSLWVGDNWKGEY